jgi:hypothetical protein
MPKFVVRDSFSLHASGKARSMIAEEEIAPNKAKIAETKVALAEAKSPRQKSLKI